MQEADATFVEHENKVLEKEEAAHEKRNWIRLTSYCNNRCTFCLDSAAHNGTYVPRLTVRSQIIDGKRKGATRLILSGGEPTIHPDYVEFIELGRQLGYRKIQTVTNGRLFMYPEFLKSCVDAGLSEITFSIHGQNAKIHDALVGVPGAFEEEVQGLEMALADGRPIINIDVCLNKGNIKGLPELLDTFIAKGVGEFDLLHIIPFGRAYDEYRTSLFYDIDEAMPSIQYALELSKRPDLHIWFNRFPPPYLEGYEELIQDPYKLNDEVRGRFEEYERWLEHGQPISCREPDRCRRCYLENLCGTLEEKIEGLKDDTMGSGGPSGARVPAAPSAPPMPPAPPQTARSESAPSLEVYRVHAGAGAAAIPPAPKGPTRCWIVGPDVSAATRAIGELPGDDLALELREYDGLAEALDDGRLGGKRLRRALTRSPTDLDALLRIEGDFEVVALLTQEMAAHLEKNHADPDPRLVVRAVNYERMTEADEFDPDFKTFFARWGPDVPVERIVACLTGREPRVEPPLIDSASLNEVGRLDIYGFTRRYILDDYYTKSQRCRDCALFEGCAGVHINYVRAHGYAALEPLPALAVAAAS